MTSIVNSEAQRGRPGRAESYSSLGQLPHGRRCSSPFAEQGCQPRGPIIGTPIRESFQSAGQPALVV